ncbi:lipopolysaccharide biosynthesis protein (plasmid) [Paracoccus liaowanqingii]|uniref:Lipopolysaccharide biosynthesis protein n=2 Tax=Paracoccus liaowanqingii TaxID=2560053 RepID=A0A4Y5SUI6_9RHOB|nr:lipopolysaccharide biosynthesis protein [Paracoccus liaowanqingii]QDA37009.1 lipopolysaccharide biosynthesis protein [Paracoccus liaowanqingii]
MLTGKALTGAAWLVMSRFMGRFIDLFTLIILARILTPEDFGLTALAMTLIMTADMVLEVPIIQALLRRQHFDDEDLNTGFTLGLLRSLLFVVFIMCAAWPFAHFYGDMRLFPLMLVLSLGPFMRGLSSPAMVRFARHLSFRQTFIVEFSGKLAAFFVAVTIVQLGGGYWAIAANSVVAVTVSVIASYIIAPYCPSLSLTRFSHFASFTGWFSLNQILAALNWQLDRILLGRFVDMPAFGKYVIATDLSAFSSQSVIGPAMQAVMAAFSSINTDRARIRQAFMKVARFVLLVSAPVCVGLSVTADLVVLIVLGDQWMGAAPMLQILALAVLPTSYFQVFYSLSLALDRPSYLFQISLVEFVLRLLFIPAGLFLLAIDGVLYARLLIGLAMFVIYMLYVRRLGGIGIRAQLLNLWRVALATATMAAAVLLLRPELSLLALGPIAQLAILAAAGAAIYVVTLRVVGIRFSMTNGFGLREA